MDGLADKTNCISFLTNAVGKRIEQTDQCFALSIMDAASVIMYACAPAYAYGALPCDSDSNELEKTALDRGWTDRISLNHDLTSTFNLL